MPNAAATAEREAAVESGDFVWLLTRPSAMAFICAVSRAGYMERGLGPFEYPRQNASVIPCAVPIICPLFVPYVNAHMFYLFTRLWYIFVMFSYNVVHAPESHKKMGHAVSIKEWYIRDFQDLVP